MPRVLGSVLAVLLAAVLPHVAGATGVHVVLTAIPGTPAPGDTFTVQAAVAAGDAFNAFYLEITFDPARVAFVPTSPVDDQRGSLMTDACPLTFHSFVPGTTLESASVSLLCQNTFVTGPGVVYRLRFRALDTPGPTSLDGTAGTRFYRAGFFVAPVTVEPAQVTIPSQTGIALESSSAPFALLTPRPSPYSGSGPVVFTFHASRESALSLAVFDAAGRRIDSIASGRFEAGDHAIVWHPRHLSAGIYFARLQSASDGFLSSRWIVVH